MSYERKLTQLKTPKKEEGRSKLAAGPRKGASRELDLLRAELMEESQRTKIGSAKKFQRKNKERSGRENS